MKEQLETCGTCISNKKKCDNPGSERYDEEVSFNGTCREWEFKMKRVWFYPREV